MITKVRNGMSSKAAVVRVQAMAMAELPLRIEKEDFNLYGGPAGGNVRILHDSPGFFTVRALGDCQHLSKCDYLLKSISSNSASTTHPLPHLLHPSPH
jgi:hypothetical protein